MAAKQFPLSIIIRAVDKATAPMRALQRTVANIGAKWRVLSDRSGLTATVEATKRLGSAMGDVIGRVAQLGTGLAAVGGIAAAAGWRVISSFAEAGGTLYDTSRAIGVTAETLQELRYAAQQNGVEAELLDNSLGILNRNLGKAFKGKGPADLLKAMKIPLRDASGQFRTMDALLPDIAEGLSKIRNPALRAAAAAELLGKGGTKLLPMLIDGKKGLSDYAAAARRLGIVISNEAVAQADEFGDKMDDLKLSFTGVRNIVGTALLPALTKLAEQMTTFVIDQGPAIKKWFDEFAENLPSHIETLKNAFSELWSKIKPVADVFEILVNTFGGSNVTIATVAIILTSLLAPGLVAVTSAMWALNVALWSNPIGIVLAVILAVVAALAYFALKIEDGRIKLTGFGEMLVWVANTPMRLLQTYIQAVVDGIGKWAIIIDSVEAAFRDLWNGLEQQFQRAIEWVAEFAGKLQSMIPDWAKGMFGGGSFSMSAAPVGAAGAATGARLAGQSAAAAQQGSVKVQLDINNLPPGSRVRTEQRGKPQFELSQGYATAGGF